MESPLVTVKVKNPDYYLPMECLIEGFEELYVLRGNRDYGSYVRAFWFQRAQLLYEKIGSQIEMGGNEFEEEYFECSEETWRILHDMIKNEEITDSDGGILFILHHLYPDWKFGYGTIRGYSQSEWQNVIYRSDLVDNLDQLEAAYFGKLYEVSEDMYFTTKFVTHKEFWVAEMRKEIDQFIRKKFGFGNDISFEVMKKETSYGNWEFVY